MYNQLDAENMEARKRVETVIQEEKHNERSRLYDSLFMEIYFDLEVGQSQVVNREFDQQRSQREQKESRKRERESERERDIESFTLSTFCIVQHDSSPLFQ